MTIPTRSMPLANLQKLLISIGLVAIATALQKLIYPVIAPAPYILYYPVIVFAAVYGDGKFAILLSGLAAQYFFIDSDRFFHVQFPNDAVRIGIFFLSGWLINNAAVGLSRTLERLRESEVRNRNVLENALDAVVAIDENSLIHQWNHMAVETFGYSREEAIGKSLVDLIMPAEHRDNHTRGIQKFLTTGEGPVMNRRIEVPAVHRLGHKFMIELTVTPMVTQQATLFYAFIRDVSARRKVEEERIRILAELQSAVRARDEFISIASHELKTPVTSMKLQFQMADRQVRSGDLRVYSEVAVQKRIEATNRQIDHMVKLIENMLDVSRISLGKFNLQVEPVDVVGLIRDVERRFSNQFASVGTHVDDELPPNLMIQADPYRLEQVFSNLFTNIIKYSPGQPARISLQTAPGRVTLQFSDKGTGIAQQDLERIFNRFERAASSNVSGLGLGLYITRQIVEAHGGKIRAESQIGQGTTIIVELPTEPRPAAAEI